MKSSNTIKFKVLLTWILFMFVVANSNAQQLNLSIIANPTLPPTAADWLKEPQPLHFIVSNPTMFSKNFIRFKGTVKREGKVVISTNLDNAARINFPANTMNQRYDGKDVWSANSFNVSFSEINLTSGKLNPGDYEICLVLVDLSNNEVSRTACTKFKVSDYQEPTLYIPSNQITYKESQLVGGINFQWGPVFPAYPSQVNYQIEIFEVPDGLSKLQTLSMPPVVDQTVTVGSRYTWLDASNYINQKKESGDTVFHYLWRVKSFDAATNDLIGIKAGDAKGYTDVREFTVLLFNANAEQSEKIASELDAPTTVKKPREPILAYPTNPNKPLKPIVSEEGFKFSWFPAIKLETGIIEYKLLVYKIEGNEKADAAMLKKPFLEKIIESDTTYNWFPPISMATTKFVWKVYARNKTRNSPIGVRTGAFKGFSKEQEFAIEGESPAEPVLLAPANDSKIYNKNLADGMTFSWKGLNPKAYKKISYLVKIFEIVKGKEGTLPVHQQEIVDTSEIVIKFPKAKLGTTYAWKVYQSSDTSNVAIGIAGRSKKGYSNVFKFTTSATQVYDTIKVYDCDGKMKFTTIKQENASVNTNASSLVGKSIKVNDFKMTVREASGTITSMKGKGMIFVTWLKTPLEVEFDGIQVNTSTMTLVKGDIYALRDNLAKDIPMFLKDPPKTKITKANVLSLDANLKANKDSKLVKDQTLEDNLLKVNAPVLPRLPMGINNLLGYTIAVTEMKFSPLNNTMVGVAILPYTRDNRKEVLAFAATDIEFSGSSPSKKGGKLALIQDFDIVDTANSSYGIKLAAFEELKPNEAPKKAEPLTYIEWDCKGFKSLKATVDVSLPRSWVIPVAKPGEEEPGETDMVKARASADVTNLNDWLISLSLDACEVQGVDNLELEVEELIIDLSDTRNPEGMKFPKNFTGPKGNDFRGMYLKKAEMTLPKFYNKKTDTTGIGFAIEDFIITKQGLSGTVTVGSEEAPIVNLETGTVGDFQASLESVSIEILNKSVTKAEVNGKMVLPITNSETKEPNTLKYKAKWVEATSKKGSEIQLLVQPDGDLKSAFLGGASLKLDSTSVIKMSYTKGKKKTDKGVVVAFVNMNGNFILQKEITKGVSADFEMHFQDLGFKYDNSKKKTFTLNKGTFSFASPEKKLAGFPITINSVEMLDDSVMESGYDASGRLRFNVNLNLTDKISGTTRLIVRGGLKKTNGRYKPALLGASIDSIAVQAKTASVEFSGTLVHYSNDPIFGDGFKGTAAASFEKVGVITAAVQFGTKKKIDNSSYRYWYAEAKVILVKGIPIVGPIALKGAGVGAWYHMKADTMPTLSATEVAMATQRQENIRSGATFVPDDNVLFGFKITGIIANNTSDKVFNGDISFIGQFDTKGGLSLLQLEGSGFIGAAITERAKAPIQGKLVASYDFTKDLFNLNVRVKIKHPAVGEALLETKEDATMELTVDGKNKINNEAKWSLTIGTPTTPNKLYYMTIETWAYFRAGNNIVTNSSFQAKTIEELIKIDSSFARLNKPKEPDANATGGKGFDFGIGFNKSDHLSIGPFSGGYSVGAELNLSMAQYDASNGCVPNDFNYWYARGGLAAWASANVSFKGLVSASLAGAAMMQGGAPKPLWVNGRVAGKFSFKVLFISIKISANVPFTYGTICRPVHPQHKVSAEALVNRTAEEIEMDELVEIGDLSTHNSGNTDRMTAIPLVSTFDMSYGNDEKTFTMDAKEGDQVVKKTYKLDIKWYVAGTLLANPGSGATWPGSPSYTSSTEAQPFDMASYNGYLGADGEGYSLGTFSYDGVPRNKRFIYNHDYKTWVVATLYIKEGNKWVEAKNSKGTVIKKTTGKVAFHTHS